MAVLIVFIALTLAACLIWAGSVELERRAEKWDRYERWMHPPDDDDGVELLKDKVEAKNENRW